jgi:hypothetical protein
MAEIGCLKDGCFQNLQVEGGTAFETVTGKSIIATGIQRLAADTLLVIAATTDIVLFAHVGGSSRVITLPPATVGRHLKIIWEVTQTTSDRVLTAAGSDDITGSIFTSITGDVVGDGDVLSVTAGTVAITCVDDVLLGSIIDFYCGVAGTWVVNGQLCLDAVGSIPTIA